MTKDPSVLLHRAKEIAWRIPEGQKRALLLRGVAQTFAHGAFFAEAQVTLMEIAEPHHREGAFLQVGLEIFATQGEEGVASLLTSAPPTARAHLLARIGTKRARSGKRGEGKKAFDEALATVAGVISPRQRSLLAADIVARMAGCGLLEEGRRAARRIEAPHPRCRAWSVVAGMLLREGRKADAMAAVASARSAANEIPHAALADAARIRIVEILAAQGEWTQAQAVAETLHAPLPRSEALGAIGEAAARSGALAEPFFAEALSTARSIDFERQRSEALLGLATRYTRIGAGTVADEIARAAAAGITRIEDPRWQRKMWHRLGGIALRRVLEGKEKEPFSLAEEIADATVRCEVLCRIVRQVWTMPSLRERTLEAVEQSLDRITDPPLRIEALCRLAEAMQLDDPDQATPPLKRATEAVSTLSDPEVRGRALSRIGGVWAQRRLNPGEALRSFSEAERAISQISSPYWQMRPLKRLIETMIACGFLEEATHLAETRAQGPTRHRLERCIALAYFRRGEETRALGIAEDIDDPAERAMALTRMARAACDKMPFGR
ncbi:MAG: hypothetical protein D6812_05005 [Deltaproteobacteria bacterium]|nr:MAG: hypothetical protein D6812_05005 [Deltaproteobacteria bacterium]